MVDTVEFRELARQLMINESYGACDVRSWHKKNGLSFKRRATNHEIEMRIENFSSNVMAICKRDKNEREINNRSHKNGRAHIYLERITAERLRELGFKPYEHEKDVWYLGKLDISMGIGDGETEKHWHYVIDFGHGLGYSYLWKPIDFVHELQILYFALTGLWI